MILTVSSQSMISLLVDTLGSKSNITAGNCNFDSGYCLYNVSRYKTIDRTWGYSTIKWERYHYDINNIQNMFGLRFYQHSPTSDHTTGIEGKGALKPFAYLLCLSIKSMAILQENL